MSGTNLSGVTPEESKTESPAEAEVASVITKRLDGIKNKDETVIRAIFDERYSKFDDWPPFRRQEAEGALKNELGSFKVLSNYSYELKDFKANVFGDVAVATFHLHYQGEIRNKHFEINSRVTSVLRRQDSGWRIVHEHFSRFPEEGISGGLGETVPSTPPPSAPSHPPARNMTRRFAIYGFISAVLSLFILPEVFGSVAIVLGAYTWKREQGKRGIIIVILGIICMIMGIEVTAPFWLGGLLLS
jgi:ketosteroid isomerase-like protein